MNLSNPTNLLIASIYFIIVGILGLFSLFGVYILLRYGKTVPLSLTIVLVYSFLFLSILFQSYQTLQTLLS